VCAAQRRVIVANENLSVSQAVRDLIKNYEGNVILTATQLNGEAHPTVGWGHYNDPSISPGETITLAQAQAYFDADILAYENFVKNAATVALTQNQFDALVMFAFNTGGGSGSQMWEAINSQNFEQAKYEWAEFRISEGSQKVKPGTIARRNDEIQLFENGEAMPIRRPTPPAGRCDIAIISKRKRSIASRRSTLNRW
jgi:lysozyme